MALTSSLERYCPDWPAQFGAEVTKLRAVFATNAREIHHIGSTAVPGIWAKPEIDILVVVAETSPEADWSEALCPLGYRRGGDLTPRHQFYKRDVSGVRTHKLHVCVEGHIQVARMLTFRDLLLNNEALRQQYQELKLALERSNVLGIAEYLSSKAPFIESALLAHLRQLPNQAFKPTGRFLRFSGRPELILQESTDGITRSKNNVSVQ